MYEGFLGKNKERFSFDFEKKTFEVHTGSGDSHHVHAENLSDELCNLIKQLWDKQHKSEDEFNDFLDTFATYQHLDGFTYSKLLKVAEENDYDWEFLHEWND